MSINDMSKEELELLSYKDITNILLEEKGALSTKDLFKTITTLLELPNSVFETKIGDYYTTLTTDKRFILVEGSWDLRDRHTSDKVAIVVDDEDDTDDTDVHGEVEEDEEDSFDDVSNDDDFDDSDDDLKDLVIMDEDELELEQ